MLAEKLTENLGRGIGRAIVDHDQFGGRPRIVLREQRFNTGSDAGFSIEYWHHHRNSWPALRCRRFPVKPRLH